MGLFVCLLGFLPVPRIQITVQSRVFCRRKNRIRLMNIGKLIKNKIDEKDGKQVCLANKMSCDKSKISRICSRPSIKTEDLIPICIHLEYNFFSDYAAYVEKQILKENRLDFSHVYKFITGEEMHIGTLIRKIKKERKITAEELEKNIGCCEKNIYRVYGYKHIDTSRLVLVSIQLNFNFFDIYAEYVDEQIQKKKDAFFVI